MKDKTRGMITGTFEPFQQVLFTVPFLPFQAGLGRNWENPFPPVNRQIPHHPNTWEPYDFPLQTAPRGQHLDARRSGLVPVPLGGRYPVFHHHPRDWVSHCARCSSTLMTPVAPKRDNSPTEWPWEKQTLSKALPLRMPLFHCQTHDLWGIWKFTTLWGERDKEIQDEALSKVKGFYYECWIGFGFCTPFKFLRVWVRAS